MVTIKAYTTIEQSRKLAKIFPLESADMYYDRGGLPSLIDKYVTHESIKNDKYHNLIPCWSLASLLEQLDDNITDDDGNDWQLEINKEDGQYYLNYHDRWGNEDDIETDYYDALVGACCEMILKLNELKML